MKHEKRSNYREKTRRAIDSYYCEVDESKNLEYQIDQAWKRREQAKRNRIQREIDCAWAEHDELIHDDDVQDEDTATAIKEYLYGSDEGTATAIKESSYSSDDDTETEESEPLYSKNKKKAARRRANVRAKKKLLKNAEIADDNFAKRAENDDKNICFHASEEVKKGVEKFARLTKRANKLKR